MALIESPGDHGITYPSQHWPFLGSQKVTPVSPLHGFFHISVLLLMKLPASWHSSFHSGYQDSVEKYIPQLWLKQGKNTLIPSAVHSSGDPDPLGGFVYLQNTVNLKAPSNPTLWWSLTFRSVGGGQGIGGAVDSDMDAEWWREVLLEGKTDRAPGQHTEGAGAGDQVSLTSPDLAGGFFSNVPPERSACECKPKLVADCLSSTVSKSHVEGIRQLSESVEWY